MKDCIEWFWPTLYYFQMIISGILGLAAPMSFNPIRRAALVRIVGFNKIVNLPLNFKLISE